MRITAVALLAAMLVVAAADQAAAYLKLGTRNSTRTVNLRWTRLPVRYFVTDRGVPGVSVPQLQGAFSRAFAAWDAVDTADVSSEFVGLTQAAPVLGDSMTVLGFQNRPELDRVLGATNFIVDTTTGEIVESDIFLNAAFPWSVETPGATGRHDVESIALHEIGHLLGLGHSALGETELISGGRRVLGAESVMFPVAYGAGSTNGRTLRPDDVAGITDIYPSSAARRSRGSISGRVTKNGAGVLGAHVVAFNPRTGALVGNFSLNQDGAFTIAGLERGPYALRVEPLDDGDIGSFFDASLNIDVNFNVRFHDRVVTVPAGGGAGGVEIRVSPK